MGGGGGESKGNSAFKRRGKGKEIKEERDKKNN